TALDSENAPAGTFSGYDANELRQGNHEAELVTEGLFEKRTEWTFTWTAPDATAGPVSFFIGMVDGDGASTQDARTSDPWHDDVAIGTIRFSPVSLGVLTRPRGATVGAMKRREFIVKSTAASSSLAFGRAGAATAKEVPTWDALARKQPAP